MINVDDFRVSDNDDNPAIQAAIETAARNGGTVCFAARIHPVRSTIRLASRVTLRGSYAGPDDGHHDISRGSVLQWRGRQSQDVMYGLGLQHATIDGIGIDGCNVANCRGIVLDSNNAPPSRMCRISNVAISRMGSPGGIDGVGIQVGTVEGIGDQFQSDGMVIERFWIYDAGTGIKIASQNSMDWSVIRNGSIGYFNRGIDIVRAGFFSVDNVVGGTYRGSDSALIYGRGPTGPLSFRGIQSEGGTGKTMRFVASDYTAPITIQSSVLDTCEFDWTCKINSIGNYYYEDVYLKGNTILVVSMGDTFRTGKGWIKQGIDCSVTTL